MSKTREDILQEAQNVGLALGVDYEKNISNVNLIKKIEAKKEELASLAKGEVVVDNTQVKTQNEVQVVKESTPEVTHDDEMMILRVSVCGNYKARIKGVKEAARRSKLTVDEIKTCLETGKAASNGYTFKEV